MSHFGRHGLLPSTPDFGEAKAWAVSAVTKCGSTLSSKPGTPYQRGIHSWTSCTWESVYYHGGISPIQNMSTSIHSWTSWVHGIFVWNIPYKHHCTRELVEYPPFKITSTCDWARVINTFDTELLVYMGFCLVGTSPSKHHIQLRQNLTQLGPVV